MNTTQLPKPDRVTTAASEKAAAPRLFSRDGLICVAIFCVCILLIWPVAEVGVNDDFVYTITAHDLARTGHFIFHGWASPMLGWQAILGALFARLFGATYTAVRLSMFPVAAFTVLVYRAVLRRFGLNSVHATFGTLALVLGPVFLPLSASFMTDVPAILPIVLCLYLCQLAVDAPTDTRTLLWLTAAAFSNIALGTVRQIAWLGILVMVPSCVWLLRRRRYVPQVGAALWLIGALCIHLMTSWFNRQPFTAPEKLIPGKLTTQLIGFASLQFLRGGMTTLLLLLPVLTIGLISARPFWRRMLIRMLPVLFVLAIVLGLLHRGGDAHIVQWPWLGNTLGAHGILEDGILEYNRPIPGVFQLLLFLAVVICTLASLEAFNYYRKVLASHAASPQKGSSWRDISILLLPFLVSYCVLLIPRATFFVLFDRYLLEVIAVLLVFVLRWHQEHISYRIPVLSTATVALVAILTVAATHDNFSFYRAEMRLANELQNAGIPRTEIRGDIAFDFATQVYAQGYLNDARILNPRNAYHYIPDPTPYKRDGVYCNYPVMRYLPALHIRYVLAPQPSPCLAPSQFAPQTYRTLLPPAKRQVYAGIQLPPLPESQQ